MRRTSDEYSAQLLGQKIYPRFLDTATIEKASAQVLELAGIGYSAESIPVPVDEIVEGYLRYHLEFDDLHGQNALGATYPKTRRVVVDESLDPADHPENLTRFRFTLGHEIGHIRLHLAYLQGLSEEPNETGPDCIVGEHVLDRQADMFAASLLMPTTAVQEVIQDEKQALLAGLARTRVHDFLLILIASMARRFQVSRKSMEIRLSTLGLLVETEPESERVTASDEWQHRMEQLARLKSF